LAGQYAVVRIRPIADGPPLFRSYSLSGAPSSECYQISVKLEPQGVGGRYLRENLRVNDALEITSPRGSFILRDSERSVLLLSAGIGATPVLAMLRELSAAHSTRQVVWLHSARDGEHHPFRETVRSLMLSLKHGRSVVYYSQPRAQDKLGEHFDAAGRVSSATFDELAIPVDCDVYLCGPAGFMATMRKLLSARGHAAEGIHTENFGGGESRTPGIDPAPTGTPHAPDGESGSGPLVSFSRSGISVRWRAQGYQNILELAEACDVPVRWSCRAGVCHSCECGLISGSINYRPEPLENPAVGNVLICCSQPTADVVLDL
jgi:ferredoxin-NADP reductase